MQSPATAAFNEMLKQNENFDMMIYKLATGKVDYLSAVVSAAMTRLAVEAAHDEILVLEKKNKAQQERIDALLLTVAERTQVIQAAKSALTNVN